MNFLKLFQIFSLTNFLDKIKANSFIEKHGVLITEDHSNTIFISDMTEIRINIGLRLPMISDEIQPKNECNFNISSKEHIIKANTFLKNAIKNNLGLQSDREDPFAKNNLLIGKNTTELTEFKALDYFKLKSNEKEIKQRDFYKTIIFEGYDTLETDEFLTRKMRKFFDKQINNDEEYFIFNCERHIHEKTLIFATNKILNHIKIILVGPLPNTNEDDFEKYFKIDYRTTRSDSINSKKLNCTLDLLNLNTKWPLIEIMCDSPERKNSNYFVTIIFKFPSKLVCESMRIRQILFSYQKNLSQRKKRQIIETALTLSAGYFGHELLDYFSEKSKNEHLRQLDNEIQAEKIDTLKITEVMKNMIKSTEVYFDKSKVLFSKLDNIYCNEFKEVEKIEFFNYLNILANEFEININFLLMNIANRTKGNRLSQISAQICKKLNSNIDTEYCEKFYYKSHYKLFAIELINFENKNSSILITADVKIPFFEYYDHKNYKVITIPKPLYSYKGSFFFQETDITKVFTEITLLHNRKLSIENCENIEETYFCNFEKLNSFLNQENICLNALFTNETNPCNINRVESISNCIITKANNFLSVSHIGKIEIFKENPEFTQNLHLIKQNVKEISKTNITIFNQLELERNFRVNCKNSEFNYLANKSKVKYSKPITYLNFQNTTNEFGKVFDNLNQLHNIITMNKTDFVHITKDLKNVNEQFLLDLHRSFNSLNNVEELLTQNTSFNSIPINGVSYNDVFHKIIYKLLPTTVILSFIQMSYYSIKIIISVKNT